MSFITEIFGFPLKCCGAKVTIKTTEQEEIVLKLTGEILQTVHCPKCNSTRTIRIRRKGDETSLSDITN